MSWNRCIQTLSRIIPKRRGPFRHLLIKKTETHPALFGSYRFTMDLSLGLAQQMFFLKPDVYEDEMQDAMKKWVKPGMTVLDIGANTGFFTLFLAKLVGPTGQVYGFEPFDKNYSLLKSNVESNELSHVKCIQKALSNKAGADKLVIDTFNDGGHSLMGGRPASEENPKEKSSKLYQVETVVLDTFLTENKVGPIGLIKIDVEGAETLVFEGALELLRRPDAPIILCEVGNCHQMRFGKTEKDLRKMLRGLGYQCFRLDGDLAAIAEEESVEGVVNVLFKK